MKLFALLGWKGGRGGEEEKFTILTTTSLGAWQNKLFLSTLPGNQMHLLFQHLPWFLEAWLLPTQESPKPVVLTQEPFAEVEDRGEIGAVGRRRHHAPGSHNNRAPGAASLTGGPLFPVQLLVSLMRTEGNCTFYRTPQRPR